MLSSKKRRRKKKKTDNFLTVRKKANTPVPPKRNKGKPKLSNSYKKEESEVQSALLSRSKNVSELDSKVIESQISFFVNNIVSNQFEEIVPDNGSEQSVRTNNENVLQLASSFVQIDDENPVEKCKKEKMCFMDTELLFYPHEKRSVGVDEKITSLRDDGLFEPNKPTSSKSMILQVNRFTEENTFDWITETNKLVGIQNFIPNNRLIRSEATKEFATILCLPRPHINNENQRHSEVNREKILKIYIHDVTFHSHPCLNKEQIVARNIENLYKQYELRRSMALADRLEMKLTALRRLQTLEISESSNADNKLTYRNDIRDLRNHLHRERRIDRDIMKSILEQWKSVKKLRKDQGFTSTSIKLSIRTEAMDEATDREAYTRGFELELNEIFEESMETYLKERKHRKSGTSGSEDFELIKKLVKPDIEVIREKLLIEYANSIRPPGEPKIFVELHKEDDTIESKRSRNNFSNAKFLFQISFDNTKLNSVRNVQSIIGDRIILDATYSVKFRNTVPNNIQLTVSVFTNKKFYERGA